MTSALQAKLAHRALQRLIVTIVVVGLTICVAQPAFAQTAPPDIPTTTGAPFVPDGSTTTGLSPGLFDISGHVQKAIDDWFTSLVTSAINPALDLLGKTLLSAPDVTQQNEVRTVWMITLGIADAAFILLALIGGITVMSHETVQTRYSVKEVAPRLALGAIAANTSLVLASQVIQLANGLAQALLGAGIDSTRAVGGIGRAVVATAGTGGFFVLLSVVATVLCLILVCLYLIRAVLVVLLVVAAPIALACHALPQTERIAVLWWRAMAACLVVQVAQALVLITAVRVFFAPDGSSLVGLSGSDGLVSLLITLCLLFIMIKIPGWAEHLVFGSGGGPVKATASKAAVVARMAVTKI